MNLNSKILGFSKENHEILEFKFTEVERKFFNRLFIVYFSMYFISTLLIIYGDIAQLARAPALQAGGQGFDSLYLHH